MSETTSPGRSPLPAPARIRRNTACTSCRDSKVKCNAALTPNRPCQRCSKLGTHCVVDKSHKRSTRRSKLEELEKEVLTIKNAVRSSSTFTQDDPPPPPPEAQHHNLPLRSPHASPVDFPGPLPPQSPRHEPQKNPRMVEKVSIQPLSPGISRQEPTPTLTARTSPSPLSRLSRQPRALRSKVVAGDDIDYYFDQYFENFHPYIPVVRVQDPDILYDTSPLLFWVIIAVACRRYARDADLPSFLAQSLAQEVWAVVASPPLSLPTINALLVLSSWPFPSSSMSNDPSPFYTAVALNASLHMGLHTWQGAHPEFRNAYLQGVVSNEEAAYTWMGCNILSQRVSANNGVPPSSCFFNEVSRNILNGESVQERMGSFGLLYEVQRFCNRISRTMFLATSDADGVPQSVIQLIEADFDHLSPLLAPGGSDLELFTVLAAKLEFQTYYMAPTAAMDKASFRRNVNRVYASSLTMIELALRLDDDPARRFLRHAPTHITLVCFGAAAVVFEVLMSSHADAEMDPDGVIGKCADMMRRCSVRENDLTGWAGKMLESCWAIRHRLPPLREPITQYPHRIGALVGFGCAKRWKQVLERAREMDMAEAAGGKVFAAGETTHLRTDDVATDGNLGLPTFQPSDSMQGIDWPSIMGMMDDFDWDCPGGQDQDASLLGMP